MSVLHEEMGMVNNEKAETPSAIVLRLMVLVKAPD
jgi:hypothetical protein